MVRPPSWFPEKEKGGWVGELLDSVFLFFLRDVLDQRGDFIRPVNHEIHVLLQIVQPFSYDAIAALLWNAGFLVHATTSFLTIAMRDSLIHSDWGMSSS